MKNKMDWTSLKTLNCPDCFGDLDKRGGNFSCKCGFVITEERLREIVEEMYNKSGDYFGRAEFEELMETED